MNRSGFTLIELLVVIAIIGILAGLFLNALGLGFLSVKRVVCLSNLKQIHLAFSYYSMDYEELYPDCPRSAQSVSPPLIDVLDQYIGNRQAMFCPADPKEGQTWFWREAFGSYTWRAGNSDPYSPSSLRAKTHSQVSVPVKIILAGDYQEGWHDRASPGDHRINVIYCDGHAKSINGDEWFDNLSLPVE